MSANLKFRFRKSIHSENLCQLSQHITMRVTQESHRLKRNASASNDYFCGFRRLRSQTSGRIANMSDGSRPSNGEKRPDQQLCLLLQWGLEFVEFVAIAQRRRR